MTGLFVGLELTSWSRNRRLLTALVATTLALVVASIWATAGDIGRQEARREASHEAREEWTGQGDQHPHAMAHFGDFVFRPSGSLARLDHGVQSRLGKVLRIEAHRQGSPFRSDANQAGTLARFARPDAAFLLQVIVPLLLVFLGATGMAADRETGRLRLSLVQGPRARAVLGGRFLALWGLGLTLLGLVVGTSLATSALLGEESLPIGSRLAGFVAVHALFFAVVAAGVVAATVWLRDARSALLALLGLWIIATAVLPRATTGVASALYPLPSQDAFRTQLREARQAGPDGHNPRDEKLKQLRKDILEEYGVDDAEDLPIDIGGLLMQADEDFGNQVWDEHYGRLGARLGHQSAVATQISLLNPFQAVDVLSMALAGTDLAHDLDFQWQAEDYRRRLVASLNDEHAYGRTRKGDSPESSAAFFAGLDGFTYSRPSVGQAVQPRLPALLALLAWAATLLAAVFRGGARLERGTLAC
ncbi:MAG: DUF3526 domain-containing protein [Myxococcota bacterium]